MANFYGTSSQHASGAGSTTVAPGPGKLYSVVATSSSATADTVTFYDNTAGSGTVLFVIHLCLTSPVVIHFPSNRPLSFSTGLTITTTANSDCIAVVSY
jgi:hypothetical protein